MNGPRNTELQANDALASALQQRNPDSTDRTIHSERTHVIQQAVPSMGTGKRPNILIAPPCRQPVIVETGFAPAPTVQQDATARLGTSLHSTGTDIEGVLCVVLPESLGTGDLETLEGAAFRYATHYLNAAGKGMRCERAERIRGLIPEPDLELLVPPFRFSRQVNVVRRAVGEVEIEVRLGPRGPARLQRRWRVWPHRRVHGVVDEEVDEVLPVAEAGIPENARSERARETGDDRGVLDISAELRGDPARISPVLGYRHEECPQVPHLQQSRGRPGTDPLALDRGHCRPHHHQAPASAISASISSRTTCVMHSAA